MYLAWKAFREKSAPLLRGAVGKKSLSALYRQGILMNVLNPKVGIFFLAFLPQFVDPAAGDVPVQMMALGALFMLQAVAIFAAVAFFAGLLGKKLLGNSKASKSIQYAKAAVFALIGVQLALGEQ